jgi:hypothetical protein
VKPPQCNGKRKKNEKDQRFEGRHCKTKIFSVSFFEIGKNIDNTQQMINIGRKQKGRKCCA